jgi:hypothetical protein
MILIRWMLVFALLFGTAAVTAADDFRVSVGEVKDNRTTGEFFAGLDVKLKIIGDALTDVKGVQAVISRAMDDTGRNLLKEEREQHDYNQLRGNNAGTAELTVSLKNPARKAASIKELSGEIRLLVPNNDPASIAVIKDFMNKTGKPLADKNLQARQVEIAILTKKQYEVHKKKEEQEAKARITQQGVEKAMLEAMGSLFSGFFQVGDNAVILQVKDPAVRIAEIEFFDVQGKKIEHRSRMTARELLIFEFDTSLPPQTCMKVYLITDKSLIRVPLKLTDIALP